jgi:hypothetical protein
MSKSIVPEGERVRRSIRVGRFADVFTALLEYTPAELGTVIHDEDLDARLQALPQDVSLKWLIALRALVSLAGTPNPMLLNAVFDRVDGKVASAVTLSWREEVKKSGLDPDEVLEAARRAFAAAVGDGGTDAGGAEEAGSGS